MDKEILKSGKALYIDLAPMSSSWKLFQAVVVAFKKNGINLKVDLETEINFRDIFLANAGECLNGLMDILVSDIVIERILDCGAKCLYEANGVKHKITLDTFEKEDSRADFFEVMYKIAIRNLKPFFPQLPTE